MFSSLLGSNTVKIWKLQACHAWTLGKKLSFWAIPAGLAAGWLVFPALTDNFRNELAQFIPVIEPSTKKVFNRPSYTEADEGDDKPPVLKA